MTRKVALRFGVGLLTLVIVSHAHAQPIVPGPDDIDPPSSDEETTSDGISPDFELVDAKVSRNGTAAGLVFSAHVSGLAGGTVPESWGERDGASIYAYMFLTDLDPEDLGFRLVDGVVALAVCSSPDLDWTPLWDENGDGLHDNDGETYHTHWMILDEESQSPTGLAVRPIDPQRSTGRRPPTTVPGLELCIDSPGFTVKLDDDRLSVVVPSWRIGNRKTVRYDVMTCELVLNTSDENLPELPVTVIHSVLPKTLNSERLAAFID